MNQANKKILWELFITFFKISPVSFGGGYAMIPLLERAVTRDHTWIKKEDIADILVLAQSAPGSIAVNTATFIGYRIAGFAGAIVGTLAIVIPTFLIILILAMLFLNFQDLPMMQAAFMGIRPTVIALILYAAIIIGKTAIFNASTKIIAICALLGFLFLPIHPIFLLILGGLVGILLNIFYAHFKGEKKHEGEG